MGDNESLLWISSPSEFRKLDFVLTIFRWLWAFWKPGDRESSSANNWDIDLRGENRGEYSDEVDDTLAVGDIENFGESRGGPLTGDELPEGDPVHELGDEKESMSLMSMRAIKHFKFDSRLKHEPDLTRRLVVSFVEITINKIGVFGLFICSW